MYGLTRGGVSTDLSLALACLSAARVLALKCSSWYCVPYHFSLSTAPGFSMPCTGDQCSLSSPLVRVGVSVRVREVEGRQG